MAARRHAAVAVALAALLAGCSTVSSTQRATDQLPQLVGPRVTRNSTPMEPAFVCMEQALRRDASQRLKIGVGQVRDYTGKFSEIDGGSAITQGGSLMTISALGKLRGAVRLFERYDTQVAEWELGFMSKRYLGDERAHQVNQNGQTQQVPWKPYAGGTVVETDYFVVGGITELNYAVYSGGVRAEVNQIGPSARTFVANVAVDLRLIDSRTLEVMQTVSLQKQVIGYEVKFSLFEFFGDYLVDFEAGTKHNEPLQLAVRTTLEQAVLELMAPLAGIDPQRCIQQQTRELSLRLTPALQPAALLPLMPPSPAAAPATPPVASDADAGAAANAAHRMVWPSGRFRTQPAPTAGPRQVSAEDADGALAAPAGVVMPPREGRPPVAPTTSVEPLPGDDDGSLTPTTPPPVRPTPVPGPLPAPPATSRPPVGQGMAAPRGIGADASRRPRELDARSSR